MTTDRLITCSSNEPCERCGRCDDGWRAEAIGEYAH